MAELAVDLNRFSAAAPGSLVTIARREHAFVPAPLPPAWTFPEPLWPLLAEAKHQIGILEGLGRNLPDPAILLRPLEDREAIRSSRLEGTYATARQLILFELQPREPRSADDPANDWREVSNYRRALHEAVASNLPLSLRLIKELHKTLLSGVRGQDRTPGEFRRIQVAIGSAHRFIPPPPERVMQCLDPFEKYLHVSPSPYDPLVDAFLVHYQFETIHPFIDGNGRVGRLLLSVMLQQRCGLTKPWLHMSEYFEQHRDDYVEKLFNVSATGAWQAWIEFCLSGTVAQARETIGRCERLLELRRSFMQKLAEVGGPVRLNRIVEDIFYVPFVQIADLAKWLEVSYPTAKADVDRLVSAGILAPLENVHPKTFYAPEIFNVAYEQID